MKNKKQKMDNSMQFWTLSKRFVSHQLPEIRKASPNTVKAYRDSINGFIDYLESEKHVRREAMTFEDFSRANITDFMDWMLNLKKYAEKTCNLRITALHSLLEFAAHEDSENLMSIYLDACTVKGIKVSHGPIEYFEEYQMKALLAAPDSRT